MTDSNLYDEDIKYEQKILNDIEVITVKTVDEVLKIALIKQLKAIEWTEVDTKAIQDKQRTGITSTH